MSNTELTIPSGGEDLSIFEILQRFRTDGSCEHIIQQALTQLARASSSAGEDTQVAQRLAAIRFQHADRLRQFNDLKLLDGTQQRNMLTAIDYLLSLVDAAETRPSLARCLICTHRSDQRKGNTTASDRTTCVTCGCTCVFEPHEYRPNPKNGDGLCIFPINSLDFCQEPEAGGVLNVHSVVDTARPQATADDEAIARAIVKPVLNCDFCLTCPDDAAALLDAITQAISTARANGVRQGADPRKHDSEVSSAFHKLWTAAVDTEGYDKKQWQDLSRLLFVRGIGV